MAAHYEIRVAGVLDGRWTAWFDGLEITGEGEETVISGLLTDQPALHGLLTRVRDLGLCLISVRRVERDYDENRDTLAGYHPWTATGSHAVLTVDDRTLQEIGKA